MSLLTFYGDCGGEGGGKAAIGKRVLLVKENGACYRSPCSSNTFTVSFTAVRNLVTRFGL